MKKLFVSILCCISLFGAPKIQAAQQPLPKAIRMVQTTEPQVALTFDLAWGEVTYAEILQILEPHKNVKVTFFLSSAWAARHPEAVKTMLERKYEIGTLGHQAQIGRSKEKIEGDLLQSLDQLKKLGVKPLRYYRPPFHQSWEHYAQLAERYHLTLVSWSINGKDHSRIKAKEIEMNVIQNIGPGHIVMLSANDDRLFTSEALEQILDRLADSKLQSVTISDLCKNVHTQTKNI
ncbi:MAG: polysaccharide deacetylase family protein [Bacilli bacterium]